MRALDTSIILYNSFVESKIRVLLGHHAMLPYQKLARLPLYLPARVNNASPPREICVLYLYLHNITYLSNSLVPITTLL
jgi:hypothetical protein